MQESGTMPVQLVIDTNVIVAGLRSRRGAAFRLLSMLNDPRWQINVSVALLLEYEEILKRESGVLGISFEEVDTIVNALANVGNRRAIPYSWRPLSHDADDDFLVELALNIRADHVITYDLRHLRVLSELGLSVITPRVFLELANEV
jgi:putative PIN family toxin of toxin-antitoxin system